MNGYIKLHRKIVKWEWYDDLPTFKLFIHLLIMVNHEDTKWRGQVIKKGSCVTSYAHLANQTGLSIKQVRNSLKKLVSTNDVTQVSTHKNTLIIVTNYNLYQDEGTPNGKPRANLGQTSGTVGATNKNDKNDKNDKNIEKEIYKEKEVVELFNSICTSYSKIIKLSDGRKKHIKARLNEGYSIEDFKTAFTKAESSMFMKGNNDRGWKATFDWIINQNNFVKILEGQYDNRTRSSNYSLENL